MALSVEEKIAKQLHEAGTRLLTPPSSVDELLPILDEVEDCLELVEQSPSKTMQDALSPLKNALVAQELLGHSDPDVKVSVATCINEITRITAPNAPYNDDQMKEIFQLIVSSFEKLDDMSSRSYKKRTTTLDTVARIRSCVVMLDLECDALILEMFQHFFKSVRDYHPKTVLTSMETIMALVLEESVDISPELFSLILEYLKKVNKNVNPVARRLSECVLMKCASKVKPYLVQAIKTLGISLDDYNNVVASVCQELSGAVELNGVNIASNEVSEADASGLKDDKIKAKETSSATNNEESTLGPVGASSKEAGITIDSDTKTTKLSSKKVESVSYQQNMKKIKRKRASLLKDNAKPPPKKVSKKSLSSPKFATKSTKKEPSSASCKRKLAGGKEKASEIDKHGEELVGSRIKVWWPQDNKFYKGVVVLFNSSDKRHKVMYDDGDVEALRFEKEKWVFIKDDSDSDKGLVSDDENPDTSEISPHKSYRFQKPADQPAALPAPKEFKEISETIVRASDSGQTLLRIEEKLDTLINLLQNFVSK